MTLRWTILSASRRFRRCASILAEIPGMSDLSSVNRRGARERYQMIFGVQVPPIMLRQKVSGHWFGGSSTVFLRRGTMVLIFSGYQMETTLWGNCKQSGILL